MIRVLVQEQRRLFRHGLAMLLSDEADIDVVGTAADSRELMRVCDELRPEVVILEADATDWDPCRLSVSLVRRRRRLAVIGLHHHCDRAAIQRGRRAGMTAVLPRSAGLGPVLEAVRTPQDSRVSPLPIAQGPGDARFPRLTQRERQVLELIGSGATSNEICLDLEISRKTVENHKQRIFAKLGVQNQAHAVALAMRNGLLPAHPAAAAAHRA